MPGTHTSTLVLVVGGLVALGCQNNPQQYPSETPAEQSAMPGESPEMYGNEMPEGDQDEQEMMEETPPEQAMQEEPEQQAQLSEGAREFIEKAGHSGMAEVELSQVAMASAKSQTVRNFAQKMIDAHTTMGDKLKQVAQELGAEPPTELSEEDKQRKEKLQQLEGRKLDVEYVDMMVDDHQKAVELFRDRAEQAEDPQLQQFAAEQLPILEEHLEHAKHVDQGKTYRAPQASASPRTGATAPSKP